jgi:hypothetical protein
MTILKEKPLVISTIIMVLPFFLTAGASVVFPSMRPYLPALAKSACFMDPEFTDLMLSEYYNI